MGKARLGRTWMAQLSDRTDGHDEAKVVHDLDRGRPTGDSQTRDDLTGPVRGHPVRHDDFHAVSRIVLCENSLEAVLDKGGFIPDGHQDGDAGPGSRYCRFSHGLYPIRPWREMRTRSLGCWDEGSARRVSRSPEVSAAFAADLPNDAIQFLLPDELLSFT